MMADLQVSVWARRGRWNSTIISSTRPTDRRNLQVPSSQTLPNLEHRGRHLSSTHQYDRLLRRLQWKCQMLLYSHHVAIASMEQHNQGFDGTIDVDVEEDSSPGFSIVAPMQFKLDFFEFYSLLERTLVHLLSIFGIIIARTGPDNHVQSSKHASSHGTGSAGQDTHIIGSSQGPSRHRFHMSVLQGFDHPGALHDILGRGETREWLGLAKDLRNLWKDVGEESGGDSGRDMPVSMPHFEAEDGDDGGSTHKWKSGLPSQSAMERMVRLILEGLEAARGPVAVEEERKLQATLDQQQKMKENPNAAFVTTDDQMDMDALEDTFFEVLDEEMEIG